MPRKNSFARADFVNIEKVGSRRKHGTLFSLSYGTLSGSGHGKPKMACVISKKIASRAVDRNLIKRRCREAMRICATTMEKPIGLIFYAKKGAKEATYNEIKKDISLLIDEIVKIS